MLGFGKPRNTRVQGARAEDEALAYLLTQGLVLIARNFNARGGELDLVMREGAVLVLVEVRFRSDGEHGDGLESVDTTKQRRLLTAASAFVAAHPAFRHWAQRFDVLALGAGGLRWVKNVIQVDSGW